MKMVTQSLLEWVGKYGQAGAARRIGRSQAHVWNMVQRVKEQGYSIEVIEVGEGEAMTVRIVETFESLRYCKAEGIGLAAKRVSGSGRKKSQAKAPKVNKQKELDDKRESLEPKDIDITDKDILDIYIYIKDHFNEICCPEMPRVDLMTEKRKKQIDRCIKLDKRFTDPEMWSKYFKWAMRSDFLSGARKDVSWRCNLDFLINPEKFVRVLEGAYHMASE